MNEETLTLYYYNDGLSDADRRAVESALAADPALADQYRQLCRQLDGLADVAPPPAPAHMVERWHSSIDRAAARETSPARLRPRFHFSSFLWGSAVAASLAIGIAITVYMSDDATDIVDPGGTMAGIPDSGAAEPTSALSRGLLVHFEDSRDQLAGLTPVSNGDRRHLVMSMVQQNRAFARAATQNNQPDLARLLRAFEPVLLQLAAEDISPADAKALQSQLAFEMNVVLTKLSRRLSKETDSIDI